MIQFDLESINQNLSPTESLNKTNLHYGTMICLRAAMRPPLTKIWSKTSSLKSVLDISGSDVLYTSSRLWCHCGQCVSCGVRLEVPWSSLRIYPSIVKSAAVAINSLLDTHKNCEPLWRTQIIPSWSNIPDHSHRLIIVTCLTPIHASKWNGDV